MRNKLLLILLTIRGLLFSQSVIITEIFFDTPLNEDTIKIVGPHHNGEFIELYNLSDTIVDLNQWSLNAAHGAKCFTFTSDVQILPKSTLIIAYRHKDTPDFKIESLFKDANHLDIIYQNDLFLKNRGEHLVLLNNKFVLEDEFNYNTEPLSPFRKDGANNGEGKAPNDCYSLHRSFMGWNSLFLSSSKYVDKISIGKVNFSEEKGLYPSLISAIPNSQPTVLNSKSPILPITNIPEVTLDGAAQVTIPLEFPLGIKDCTPQLSIKYNSLSHIGSLGYGSTLSGLSSITLSSSVEYIDGVNRPLSEDGPYSKDGMRLIHLRNNEFRYEQDNTDVIYKINNSFKIAKKDGSILEYGYTPNSIMKESTGVPIIWFLSKVSDPYVNYILYNYKEYNNEVVLDNIKYSGTLKSQPINTINFKYIDDDYSPERKAILTGYIYRKKLLSEISIQTPEISFCKYKFEYKECQLQNIIEYNIQNEARRIKFNWGKVSNYNVKSTKTTMPGRQNTFIISGDLIGNGIKKLFRIYLEKQDNNGYYDDIRYSPKIEDISLENGLFPTKIDSNFPEILDNGSLKRSLHNFFFSDIDNDGKDDLIVIYREDYNKHKISDFKVLIYDIMSSKTPKKEFVFPSSQIDTDHTKFDINLYSLDFKDNSNLFVTRSDGNYWNCENWENIQFDYPISLYPNKREEIEKTIILDLSMDNYPAIISKIKNTRDWRGTYLRREFDVSPQKEFDLMDYGDYLCPLDINNDGLIDFISMNRDGTMKVFENKNNSFENKNDKNLHFDDLLRTEINKLNLNSQNDIRFEVADLSLIPCDLNNDGLKDFIAIVQIGHYDKKNPFIDCGGKYCNCKQRTKNYLAKNYIVYYVKKTKENYNAEFVDWSENWHKKDYLYDRFQYMLHDVNLDDIPELLKIDNKEGCITYYLSNNNFKNYLHSVSINNIDKYLFEYSSANSSIYRITNTSVTGFRINNFLPPLCRKFSYLDGVGNYNNNYYSYTDGIIDKKRKKYIGFKSTLIRENNKRTSIHRELDTLHGIYNKINKYLYYNDRLVEIEESKYSIRLPFDKIYRLELSEQINQDLIDNNTTKKDYQYDNEGRVEETLTSYQDGSYEKVICKEYNNFNLPKEVTNIKKHIDDDEIIIKNKYIYNAQGSIVDMFYNYEDSINMIHTKYRYTSAGLVEKMSKEGNKVETINEILKYDNNNVFVTSKSNGIIQEIFDFDNLSGSLKSSTLCQPGCQDQCTSYDYDNWYNLVQITYPNKTIYSNKRKWHSNEGRSKGPFYYVEEISNPGESPITIGYDILDRIIYKSIKKGDIILENYIKYNKKGEVVLNANIHPYKEYIEEISYDQIGRKEKIINNKGEKTTYTYSNNSATIINNNNNKTIIEKDSWGNLKRKIEPNGATIEYKYHSSGNPKTIKCVNNVISLDYDNMGRRIEIFDPNAGKYKTSYDAFNRIKEIESPKNMISFKYDSLGRMHQRITNKKIIETFSYYESGKGFNQIKSLLNNGGMGETYKYDEWGNTTHKSIISFGDTVNYEFAHDIYGRVTKTIYPNNTIINYKYNNQGECIEIYDSINSYWSKIVNITENEINSNYGNKIKFEEKFSQKCDLIERKVINENKLIYSSAYTIDNINNNVLKIVEECDGNIKDEEYNYDNMDRLININRNNIDYTIDYSLDNKIINKSNVGNYNYESLQPHAVSSIDTLIENVPCDIIYDHNNKISKISNDNYSQFFYYGVNGKRIKSILLSKIGKPQIRNYFDNYETIQIGKQIDQYCYISTPDGNIILKKNNDSIFYVFKDLNNSWLLMCNKEGDIIETKSYDAWGRSEYIRKDNSNNLLRGYGGHEEMPHFDLINMEGRIYDPLLGLFISPDINIQLPDNSLNYNRYAFGMNNPMKYSDPTGNSFAFVGASIGMFTNLFIQTLSGNINSTSDAFKHATIGAASGLLGFHISSSINSSFGLGFNNGFISGFINGFTTSSVKDLATNLKFEVKNSIFAGISSGLIGGIANGLDVVMKDGNFWTGKGTTLDCTLQDIQMPNSENNTASSSVEYSNEAAKQFSDDNFGHIMNLNNLYADGTLPQGYVSKENIVYNKGGDVVLGSTVYLGNRKSNVYLYPRIFQSKKNLYLTMGHEYIHVKLFAFNPTISSDRAHKLIYKWQYNQSDLWNMPSNNTKLYYKSLNSNNPLSTRFTFPLRLRGPK